MRARRGFTLLEVLIAMTLFTVIGFGVVLLMRTSVEMYVRGNEASQIEDRWEQSLPRLEDDLRHVLVAPQIDRIPFDPKNPDPDQEPDALPPENRFLSGYQSYKIGDKPVSCRYLAFVRDLSGLGEIETYASRAGTNPRADAYIDGKDDDREFRENRHLPTGGAAEVLWIWLPDPRRPGVGSVCRAYRSPIGGTATLLDPANYDEIEEVERLKPLPMFQDVILFDALLWTQWTTTWDWSPGQPGVTGPVQDLASAGKGRASCGPSLVWDSTRGLLTAEGEWGFRLSRGANSFRFSGDDIWPRSVRISFALVDTQTTLALGVGAADATFTVDAGDFATGRGEISNHPMKIGTEWLEVSERDGLRRDTFRIGGRGQRGTAGTAHGAGEPVYFGRVFDFTIPIPSYRDDNN